MNNSNPLLNELPDILHSRVERHWHDWQEACRCLSLNTDVKVPLAELARVWGSSEFVAQSMIRNPELWFELVDSNLDSSMTLEDYRKSLETRISELSVLDDMGLMQCLRHFRSQQMIRIAWRDLLGKAGTDETLRNLTELAETCVDIPLEIVYQDQCEQLGVPLDHQGNAQRMVVLGMGKLGGHELNFSSDIDLIFAFAEEGETQGGRSLANSQFFIRLGQRFIKLLNDVTADGFVFRVDMRLRPYGDSGPLAMSHGAMEQYYQTQGRDWERYAMIKARVIGGDRREGEAIMQMLKPFIYRRYLDFGAFQSIREMKGMIDSEIRRKGNLTNIKLGSGGIREIEFIGQTFQLIRAGGDPELQIRGIVPLLKLLEKKAYLQSREVDALLQSYDFLRRLENRLQMYADKQTHLLPDTPELQSSMALAMGYPDWQPLADDCEKHRQTVHHAFQQLLHEEGGEDNESPEESIVACRDIWLHCKDAAEMQKRLQQLGMADEDAEAAQAMLQQLQTSSAIRAMTATGRQRLDILMPRLLNALLATEQPSVVLQRLLSLLQSVLRRSVYLSLLNEYPSALQQLVKLCAASPWIAHLLSRYPVLLDELLDPRHLYEMKSREQLANELELLLSQVSDDEEQQLERLRKFKQAQVLRIAAMDISGNLNVFEVSEQLSLIAEVLLCKVKALAGSWMESRFGRPQCVVNDQVIYPDIGIVAYGKMGGEELGYGSDLDLVFLHNSQGSQQQSDGKRSLDNASYFARYAQRMIHLLSAQTANGRLYEIDMRLRPDGNAGMLVSSLNAYEIYQQEKAWTWEHQALVRARLVCSNAQLKAEFGRIRRTVLMKSRDEMTLAKDVVEMRQKMRDALGSQPGSAYFHLKQDAGGLVDIEFLAQYGVLLNAQANPVLLESTATRQILKQLAECQLMERREVKTLADAYQAYRALSHQLALQEQSSQLEQNPLEETVEAVKVIWSDVLNKHRVVD